MPNLKPRALIPDSYVLTSGVAAGASADDFYVLATSEEYDEVHSRLEPQHDHFTHILRFEKRQRTRTYRVPDQLNALWWDGRGAAYAAGGPTGVVRVRDSGCDEQALEEVPGVFSSLWGTSEEHLFACGLFAPFALYRRFGTWHALPLPDEVQRGHGLHDVLGQSEQDVYFVGYAGALLHFDGNALRSLECPTTRTLICAARLGPALCIAGYGGTLLCGGRDGFRLVPTETEEPIHSLARFADCVWFPTPEGLWRFDGKSGPTLQLERPLKQVSSVGDALLLLDDEELSWLYDGQALSRLELRIP